jgi:hypothetical protein
VLPEPGPNLNLKDLAIWLEKEHSLKAPKVLYSDYYIPLSHFFAHPSAFTLMRHVGPDERLRRKPLSPWSRRSAVRLADCCTGLMAKEVADKADSPSALFTAYAGAHASRVLVPATVMAVP